MLALDDRVALVTGATSGIGEATAYALARAGARVLVVGRRVDHGAAVVEHIRSEGGDAAFYAADMTSTSDVDAMVAEAVRRWGRLDIAFNNAGIFDGPADTHEFTDEAWDRVLAVNLSGVFRCMRAEIAAMLPAGHGVIVNNASTVGHRGTLRAGPAYVAAKHGVIGLTRQAALQYVERGIRVNAVSPGPTLTPVAAAIVAGGPEAVRASLASLNPTADFVSPADVAAAVVYLCTDAAAMINGHDLPLDGGQLAKL